MLKKFLQRWLEIPTAPNQAKSIPPFYKETRLNYYRVEKYMKDCGWGCYKDNWGRWTLQNSRFGNRTFNDREFLNFAYAHGFTWEKSWNPQQAD